MSETLSLLFDPMFRIPFFTGLALAAGLSLMGALLRMREEWLAALGLSQVAAAGAIAAVPLGLPVLLGAFGAAGLGLVLHAALPRAGNSHHALLIIVGWSATLLIGAHIDHGQTVGESLLRGQLYFTRLPHLLGAAGLLAALLALWSWLSPRLLTARFFPDYHSANRNPVWPYQVAFSLLVIIAVVLGTISIGAFPAFAMLFVPPWVGFVLVGGWRRSVVATAAVGCGAYIAAFVLAIVLDLPFGPVLTGTLICTASLRFLTALRRRNIPVSGDQTHVHYLAPPEKPAPVAEDPAAG